MAILKAAELHVTTDELEPVPSSRHQRRYQVRVPDGRALELVLPPSSMARLLRSEQSLINSEAAVVRWIRQLVSHETSRGQRPSTKEAAVASPSSVISYDDASPVSEEPELPDLLPKLVHHCAAPKEFGIPYSIFQRNRGTAISALPGGLTEKERSHVDFQRGRLTRRLSDMRSPSGRFGLAASVLSEGPSPRRSDGSQSPPGLGGTRTWSAAFHSMLEGILRDGEDMAVTISYSAIRRHFKRLRYLLDSVMVPRLVIIDGADHSNVLVTRTEGRSDDTRSGKQRRKTEDTNSERDFTGGGGSSTPRKLSDEDVDDGKSGDGKKQDDGDEEKADDEKYGEGDDKGMGTTKKQTIRVTGLRDWSNCVFGDPLFARAFSDDPSDAFLRGFYGSDQPAVESPNRCEDDDVPIGDEPNSHIRLLLYQAYHAIVSIIREFYGQRTERSRMELAARKKLTETLAQLDGVDDEPKRRHRRPSGEMSPAKKVRQSPDVGP